MSDHPKEAERNLKRIRICNDVYFDVFHLLSPAKVGLELALVSHRFDALVDMQFKSRKWTLGKLSIDSENIVKTNDDGSKKALPFPLQSLPNSIVGFSRVNFFSTASDVIDFLRRIGHLLEKDVCLDLDTYEDFEGSNWIIFATTVWPLLNVSAIIKIHFGDSSCFQYLRHLISSSILCDCFNLRMISFSFGEEFLEFPPDDSKGSSDDQALCKWLHTPRTDGQPKVFKNSNFWELDFSMDGLKAAFLNATTSVSFIILLGSVPSVGPFELVNSLTREQLTSQQIGNDGDDVLWLLERCPIDKCAKQWAKWEREAMDDGKNKWKVLGIYP